MEKNKNPVKLFVKTGNLIPNFFEKEIVKGIMFLFKNQKDINESIYDKETNRLLSMNEFMDELFQRINSLYKENIELLETQQKKVSEIK